MRIIFASDGCIPFHGQTLLERPLGGTETAVIRLAEALDRLGHSVFVFTSAQDAPPTKPAYLPLSAIGEIGSVDVLVSVRGIRPALSNIDARSCFLWTGDSHTSPSHLGIGDRRIATTLTGLWCVSSWHAQTLCEASGFPESKTWVVRNGFAKELFSGSEIRNRKRLIYSSTPFRGLALLPEIFPRIRKVHQDAELHIFSGMKVYEESGTSFDEIQREFAPVFKALGCTPGCYLHGNVTQDTLAREFMRSGILAYPNTFDETSCITAIEAIAAGCVPITSHRGALPETVGDAGILISEPPGSPAYNDLFVASAIALMNNEAAWNHLSHRAITRAAEMSWDFIAQDLTERLREHLTLGPSTVYS
jgi:glycosyltransferase involved in cell wall biosynthesis